MSERFIREEMLLGGAAMLRLRGAHVAVFGLGGVGGMAAEALARGGIGKLTLIDGDSVALSNLNRQYFFPHQVDLPKVEALAHNLRDIHSDLDLEMRRDPLDGSGAVSFFMGCDVVVEAVDSAAVKQQLILSLLEAGHRVVAASGMAGWGGDMKRRSLGRLTVVGDCEAEIGPHAPALAPRVMMAAAMQADEVIRLILEHTTIEPIQLKPLSSPHQ